MTSGDSPSGRGSRGRLSVSRRTAGKRIRRLQKRFRKPLKAASKRRRSVSRRTSKLVTRSRRSLRDLPGLVHQARWRSRGYAILPVGGHRLRFYNAVERSHRSWAMTALRGGWEPEELDFVVRNLRPGDVMLDVGAWVGTHAMVAARAVGDEGAVYAFEPDPVARAMLEANLAGNAMSNVRVRPEAVGAAQGTLRLDASRAGGSKSRVSEDRGSDAVPSVTLEGFCQRNGLRPALVKIDVEGGEADVLAGAPDSLLAEVPALLVELHRGELASRGRTPEELLERLAGLGYERVPLGRRSADNASFGLVRR